MDNKPRKTNNYTYKYMLDCNPVCKNLTDLKSS